MSVMLRWLGLFGCCVVFAIQMVAAPGNGAVTVTVARRDLRPLAGVTVQIAGVAQRQGMTDGNGQAAFLDLPRAGAVTITPLRSGFRFEPAQITIPDLTKASTPAFVAFPT